MLAGIYLTVFHLKACFYPSIRNCGPEAKSCASSLISNNMTIVFVKTVEVISPKGKRKHPASSISAGKVLLGRFLLTPPWPVASANSTLRRNEGHLLLSSPSPLHSAAKVSCMWIIENRHSPFPYPLWLLEDPSRMMTTLLF